MAELAGRTLHDRIVVITGASSGLGRAIALELARRGSTLVLGARRADALEDTARDCRTAGGHAVVVAGDVTVAADVDRLAAAALDGFNRIDAWINNAGVALYSALEDGPLEHHRRVIETNLFGALHGARAAVPVFRAQGWGTLINIGSVLGAIGHAMVPSYVISKFGVRGLSEALRVELADEPDIHVCTVCPYAIDTPHFEVAGNRLRHEPRAMPPLQSPERVARAVADVLERPRRTRYVPRVAVLGLVLHALRPRTTERLLLDALRRWHLSQTPEPTHAGNLYAPADQVTSVHGDRPPRLGTARLLGWAASRLVRLELESVVRRAHRAYTRLRNPGESSPGSRGDPGAAPPDVRNPGAVHGQEIPERA